MPLPAWKAGDLLPLCRVPWEEQGISGFPGTSKQTVWPGKWDLAVKGGLAAHLPALPNTPIIYETNLLSPCAGPCRDRPCGTCPGVVCFFSPDRLTPWCSAFHRGIRGDFSREVSTLPCSQPSSSYHPARLTRRCRWLIEPSGRPRGVCGAGHTRLRPLEARGDDSPRRWVSDTHGAQPGSAR